MKVQPITIIAEDLSKRFNREWIFKNFSYQFSPGFRYAVTGPNGSGKSTLLQILWGQTPPTAGRMQFRAEDGSFIDEEDFYQHIAIAAPYMDLIEDLTLRESLEFHFKLKRVRNNLTFEQLLEIFYLRESSDKFIRNFSSGMKQRLKLGLAFYTEASLIFLDEPGSHLDETALNWYHHQLQLLPKNCVVIIGSNDPNEYRNHITHTVDLKSLKS